MLAQLNAKFILARPWKVWSRLMAYLLFEGRPLTTKGRWINPLVFRGYRLWHSLPNKKPVKNPIFVLGTGRSGTTVLGTILALHRDVGYLNEPKAMWHAALRDDDLIGSYSGTPGRYKMSERDLSPAKSNRLTRSYQAFMRLSFSKRIVDKYPELIFRTPFLNVAFDDPKFIVLVRNGIDTIQSIERWSNQKGLVVHGMPQDWWGKDNQKWHLLVEQVVAEDPVFQDVLPVVRALRSPVDMAAVEWVATMNQAIQLVAANQKNVTFVRFESLVTCPAQTISQLLNFCDLPKDMAVIHYAKSVLKPGRQNRRPALHPAIAPLFDDTMRQLGYCPDR